MDWFFLLRSLEKIKTKQSSFRKAIENVKTSGAQKDPKKTEKISRKKNMACFIITLATLAFHCHLCRKNASPAVLWRINQALGL